MFRDSETARFHLENLLTDLDLYIKQLVYDEYKYNDHKRRYHDLQKQKAGSTLPHDPDLDCQPQGCVLSNANDVKSCPECDRCSICHYSAGSAGLPGSAGSGIDRDGVFDISCNTRCKCTSCINWENLFKLQEESLQKEEDC